MKRRLSNLIESLRLSWIGAAAFSLQLPAILLLTFPGGIDANHIGGLELAASFLVMIVILAWAILGQTFSLRTQHRLKGLGTFERIHALAQTDLPDTDFPVAQPRWIMLLGTPFPRWLSLAFPCLVLLIWAAMAGLSLAPETWLIETIGPAWLDPGFRLNTARVLIGLLDLLLLRQTFVDLTRNARQTR